MKLFETFSVDYTAHVAYQYFRASGSPQEKVLSSLHEMAAPMVEVSRRISLKLLNSILGRFIDFSVHAAADLCAYLCHRRLCEDHILDGWHR